MSLRKYAAILLLAIPSPVLAEDAISSERDPLNLEAKIEAQADAIAVRARDAALGRSEQALQRAVDRKVADRLSVALVPPVRPWQLGATPATQVAGTESRGDAVQ